MLTILRNCTLLLCLFVIQGVYAQNILITHSLPDQLYVCGEDQFNVTIYNTSAQSVSGARLQIKFPSGLRYVPGSVSGGATEQNITNLAEPLFNLPTLASSSQKVFAFSAYADCAAAAILDAGLLFQPLFKVINGVDITEIIATPFPVETGLLVVQSVDFPVLSGERLDTLFRKICLKNTRLGAIENLLVSDEHPVGFETFFPNANVQNNTLTLGSAQYDGSLFAQFGDGDQLLESNEVACFTERIAITDCGIPQWSAGSKIKVGWGCGSGVCRYDSVAISVDIKESKRVPELKVNQIWSPPVDHCAQTPAQAGLRVQNIGLGVAQNAYFEFDVPVPDIAGISNFRLDQGGNISPLPLALNIANTAFSCTTGIGRKIGVSIPVVAPGETVRILFDYYNCESSCSDQLPGFNVNYFYTKPCPVNGFVSDTTFIEPFYPYTLNSGLFMELGKCVEEGETVEMNFCVSSRRLIEPTGYFNLDVRLPSGFTPACSTVLGGVAPTQTNMVGDPDSTRTWQLRWKLPLNNDTLCLPLCFTFTCEGDLECQNPKDYFPNVQISVEPDCAPACFVPIFSHGYWTPTLNSDPLCAPGDCDTVLVALHRNIECVIVMPNDSSTIAGTTISTQTPGSGYTWGFEAKRLNIGLPDNNDDRNADALSGTAQAPGVRRDRFLPGDTLRVRYFFTVDSGGGYKKYTRSIFHEIVGSDQLDIQAGNDQFLVSSSKDVFAAKNLFQLVGDSMRIRYASGAVYTCPTAPPASVKERKYFQIHKVNAFPPEVIDDVATLRYAFFVDVEALYNSGCLPKPTLDKGDSLILVTDFKLNFNYRPISTNNPDPPLIGFRTAMSHNSDTFAHNKYNFVRQQYSGFREKREGNQYGIRPCENSTEIKPFRYTIRLARPNLFPYEVRPLSQIQAYRQFLPEGVQVAAVMVDSLTLQDNTVSIQDMNLPNQVIGNELHVDYTGAYANPVDEGYAIRSHFRFLQLCNFPDPDSGRQFIKLKFEGCLREPNIKTDSIIQSIGYFSNHPALSIESADTVTFPADDIFNIQFKVRNTRATQAQYPWVALQSPNGVSSDITLTLLPQNQVITPQNGVFNIGAINGFSFKNFRLSGKNLACDPDSLLLLYGWDCAPVTSLNTASCARDSFYFILEQQSPELEMELLAEDTNVKICEPSAYFEIEILNGKTGTAYDPLASIQLPQGAAITPGSAQYAYPAGSAWQTLPDPTLLSGNLYRWDLAALISSIGQNGLPGFQNQPQNKIRIRFKISPECGFVANSPLLYQLSGVEPCGQASNSLNKPGDPLKVEGLNAPYGVSLSLQSTGAGQASCGAVLEYQVNMNILGTPSAQDSAYVRLPSGLTYVSGSYVPGQNAPSGNPKVTVEGFQVALPTQLSGGGQMSFRFKVQLSAQAGCEDVSLQVQTRVKNTAFCSTTGTDCAVYFSTGEASLSIDVQHPEFALLSSVYFPDAAPQPRAVFQIQNSGNISASALNVEIWHDVNGNQTKDAGDLKITDANYPNALAPGGNAQISALLNASLCQLLLVFPADKNCLCEDLVFSLQELTLKHEDRALCALDPLSLGPVAQSGFNYQWSGAGNFGCAQCATTQYTPPPGTPTGSTLNLLLVESNGSCILNHEYKLIYGNVASIQTPNNTICEGKNAVLTVQPAGQSYSWQGPGILNPGLAQQNFKPSGSATYQVTVTFDNGCTSTASTQITVLAADTLYLAPMQTCAGEAVVILGTQTASAGVYNQKLLKKNGCDSLLVQELKVLPKPYSEESRAICKGDTLFLSDTLLTAPGDYCRNAKAFNGCDSTHCLKLSYWPDLNLNDPDTLKGLIGELIKIQGPDGFTQYSWDPKPLICNNCSSFTVRYDSSGLYPFQLVVKSQQGCTDTIVYRLLIFPPCNPQNVLVPNVFTPDGDGINDNFQAFSPEKSETFGLLSIYDRWGEKVYESTLAAGWDGKIKGEPAPVDVYVYRIQIVCSDGEEVIWGDVTLLR